MCPHHLDCCRDNMAHIRHSRPDSGLDFQVLEPFQVVPSSLGSGPRVLHQHLPVPTEVNFETRGRPSRGGGGGRTCAPTTSTARGSRRCTPREPVVSSW